MNIKEFKEGDLITRNAPVIYGHDKDSTGDSSWCGDKFIFKGHDPVSKIIFFEHADGCFKGDIGDISYARDAWDEGWCYYPETLWKKIKKIIA